MIEIKLKDSFSSTTRPYFKVKVSDNDRFDKALELNALIDTGADISFLNEKHFENFDFFKKTESRNGKEQILYKASMRIDDLTNFHSQFVGKRHNRSTNPDEQEPDLLIGRDFLKNVNLKYYGPENRIEIEWKK